MKRLLARLFNRDLAIVQFGDEYFTKYVSYTCERRPYVTILGWPVLLDEDCDRRVIWLRRKHFQPKKREGNVIQFPRPAA